MKDGSLLSKGKKDRTIMLLLAFLLISSVTCTSKSSEPMEDKSSQIASWIESKVNTKGYNGCQCRSLGINLVRCDLHFPAGTNTQSVELSLKKTAELFAQVGRLKSTIHYVGYSGSQNVCEYKYDMYDATVTKTK